MFDNKKFNIIKLIEIMISSVALLSILTYISGYQILSGFFRYQFNQTYFYGGIIPTTIFLYLGLILVISIIATIPIIYLWTNDIHSPDNPLTIILAILIMFLYNLIKPLQFIKKYGLPLQIIIIVIMIALAIFIIFKLLHSYKKKGLVYKFISSIYKFVEPNIFLFLIILPLIYPDILEFITKNDHLTAPIISEIKIDIVYRQFFILFSFTLALFVISIKRIIKFDNKFNWLKVVLLIGYTFSFIYSFSNQIGKALSESYKRNNSGIFPKADLLLSQNIFLKSGNASNSVKNISFFIITKDEKFYYGFEPKKKTLLIVPLDKILSAEINNK